MASRTRSAVAVLLVALSAATAAAEDLHVTSAGAVEPGLVRLIEQFMKAAGHKVTVQFGTGPQLTARLAAGEVGDVLIAPKPVMDQAAADRKVNPATRMPLGRVGVGIVVRRGLPAPDISSIDRLTAALLAADTVVYNRGSTGIYVEQLLAKLGVATQVAAKTVRVDNGEAVMERLVAGKGQEIGFAAITEIRLLEPKGARLVGALPADIQNFTSYDGAVTVGARAPHVAAEFVRFVTNAQARGVLAAAGIEAPE